MMETLRKLSAKEENFIAFLIENENLDIDPDRKKKYSRVFNE